MTVVAVAVVVVGATVTTVARHAVTIAVRRAVTTMVTTRASPSFGAVATRTRASSRRRAGTSVRARTTATGGNADRGMPYAESLCWGGAVRERRRSLPRSERAGQFGP